MASKNNPTFRQSLFDYLQAVGVSITYPFVKHHIKVRARDRRSKSEVQRLQAAAQAKREFRQLRNQARRISVQNDYYSKVSDLDLAPILKGKVKITSILPQAVNRKFKRQKTKLHRQYYLLSSILN